MRLVDELGDAGEPRVTSVQQLDGPDRVEVGVAVSDVVELVVTVSEVGLGVVVSDVVELLGDAKPEVEELGVAVSELRTQGEVEFGNDGAVRFVHTSSRSSSSEKVDVEPAATRPSQLASSGRGRQRTASTREN